MRAAVFSEEKRFEPRDVPDPEPGAGRVVVRVAGCGICGSDLHMVSSGLVAPGTVLGHEAAGVVESLDDDIPGIAVGDPVAIHPSDPCGRCGPCVSGATQRCVEGLATTIGLGLRPGAFAERVDVAATQLTPLPGHLPLELAALTEPLAVALHGFRRSAFEPGMTVGVIGCGPIGLCSVIVAKALGAGRIWAADPNGFRAELARTVGADQAGPSPAEADIVVECAGAPGTLDLAAGSAAGGGQVVLLAVNIAGDGIFPVTWVTKEVSLLPCLGYTRGEYEEAADLIASGRADVATIVTRRASLEDTDDAFRALLDGASEGKVLVIP